MRLAIDASNLRAGGGVTHLRDLLAAADPPAHGVQQVTVWAGRSTLEQIPERRWINRVHQPALDGPVVARLWWRKRHLPALAQSHGDLLFTPGGGDGSGDVPFVTMSRNLLPFEAGEMRRYGLSWTHARLRLLRTAQAQSFRRAAGVIFLTEHARTAVLEATGPLRGRTTIIPHGVDRAFRRPAARQEPLEAFTAARPFRLLYVSIVDLYKHQERVAAAVGQLRQEGYPVVLDLIGPAYRPAWRKLERVSRTFDPERRYIRYLGPVPHVDLPAYYHAADAFVFASTCENLPNVLLEAMASGLPIACSTTAPMPEVVGDAPFFFDAERLESMTASLRMLLRDHEGRAHCAALVSRRAADLTWERCASATFEFLRESAAAPGAL